MKKKRFASHLLTGKVAASPFMISSGFAADAVPTYQDILNEDLSVIELPKDGVRLFAIGAVNDSYGGNSGVSAAICDNNQPESMNIVITGAKSGDRVFLVASSSKDDGFFQHLNEQIRVGSENFTVISSFLMDHIELDEDTPGDATAALSPVSVPVNLAKLSENDLLNNGRFYVQAVIFSSLDAENIWEFARYSELDTIEVSSAGCGGSYDDNNGYGGSTY